MCFLKGRPQPPVPKASPYKHGTTSSAPQGCTSLPLHNGTPFPSTPRTPRQPPSLCLPLQPPPACTPQPASKAPTAPTKRAPHCAPTHTLRACNPTCLHSSTLHLQPSAPASRAPAYCLAPHLHPMCLHRSCAPSTPAPMHTHLCMFPHPACTSMPRALAHRAHLHLRFAPACHAHTHTFCLHTYTPYTCSLCTPTLCSTSNPTHAPRAHLL